MNINLTEREAARAAKALRKSAEAAREKGKEGKAMELSAIADKLASAWVRERVGEKHDPQLATKTTTRAREADLAIERGGHLRLKDDDAKVLHTLAWHLKCRAFNDAKIDSRGMRSAQSTYTSERRIDLAEACGLIGDRIDEIEKEGERAMAAVWFAQAMHAISIGEDVRRLAG